MMDDFGFDEDFDFDNDMGAWPPIYPIRPPMPPRRGRGGGFGMPPNNDRYNNAYGNYRGGYGPGGGFGPPLGFRGPGPRGPPPLGPPGPPGPMIMFGRGFVPGGPPPRNVTPQSRAFRYLLRCGVARESIKNLPKEMLLMMEPEYCGVCAMEFDSFVMSRMHYTSRNHAKNQRKWITQNTERKADIPSKKLKARELYCELCDVHITSVTHADSHYAGKPHRAIVEGRKKPKNPYLLQKGMEQRIAQLLKREKEQITATAEPAKVAEDAELKPGQAELYCDICKTSVTCSEQMTMHLNGKKHLSKEKQHIIRVMNGQKDDNGVAPAEAAESNTGTKDDNGVAPAEATESTTAPAADDGDWGNGSGTWEET